MTRIVLADNDRLIVTHAEADDMVVVLRPRDAAREPILALARLVLPRAIYDDVARYLAERSGTP